MGVSTTIQYLARSSLYKTEKPFSTDFEVDDEFPGALKANYSLSSQSVSVTPIQDDDAFNMDVHGFCVIKAATNLTRYDALNWPRDVEDAYFQELEAILHQTFPQYTRFEAFEFVVRRRDERFPSSQVAIVEYEQPACLAHSDFSAHGAMLQLAASFPGQQPYFEAAEFDMIK